MFMFYIRQYKISCVANLVHISENVQNKIIIYRLDLNNLLARKKVGLKLS